MVQYNIYNQTLAFFHPNWIMNHLWIPLLRYICMYVALMLVRVHNKLQAHNYCTQVETMSHRDLPFLEISILSTCISLHMSISPTLGLIRAIWLTVMFRRIPPSVPRYPMHMWTTSFWHGWTCACLGMIQRRGNEPVTVPVHPTPQNAFQTNQTPDLKS